jgi:CheY-like chemotaxis protein
VLAGVWDTGPGIPAASRRLIFEEFRRLDPDAASPGLGLGLAIAERTARLLDHELVLDSREGRGTLFGVRLPRVDAARRAGGAAEAPEAEAGGRALVVDNDAQMLASLAGLLRDWSYSVEAATNAADARRMAAAGPFDAMVLDYHLDDGSTGLELLEDLRGLGQHGPAVLVSADHAAELQNAARQAGCALLHKPIRPLALRSMLRRCSGGTRHDFCAR